MIKLFDQNMLDTLSHEAASRPRRRTNLNLHHSLDDPLQKLFIAMQKDSYVRPHRHPGKEQTELLMAVRGSFAVFIFDDEGVVTECIEFSPDGEILGTEITPGIWHTIMALDENSVFIEIKQGPYSPLSDDNFAAWAPEENSVAVKKFMHRLEQVRFGEQSAFP